MSLPGPDWVLTIMPPEIPIRTTDPSAGRASTTCKGGPCTVGLLNFSSPAPGGPVRFQMSTHLSGAVFRITYIDTEFIQPMMIAGGSLQSDVFYDGVCEPPCRPEGKGKINPTEAGAQVDAFTGKSSSRLLSYKITDTYVTTTVLGAYYFGGGTAAKPMAQPSDTKISKRIEYLGTPGEFEYTVTFEFSKKQTGALFEVLAGWIPNASSETIYAYSTRGGDKWHYWLDANKEFGDGQDHLIAPVGMVTTTRDGKRAWGVVPVRAPKHGDTQLKCLMRAGRDVTDSWKKFSVVSHGNDAYPLEAIKYTWSFRMFFGPLIDVASKVRETVLRVAHAGGPDASGLQ